MKKVRTEDAVSHVISHDITQIIPGGFKGARFKKGHIVREEDIPVLLSLGKTHLYMFEPDEDMVHEDEGAGALASVCTSSGMSAKAIGEGRIDIFAETDGLLKVDAGKLAKINSLGQVAIASRHGDIAIRKGDKIAGMRVVPLLIKREILENVRKIGDDEPIFEIKPFEHKRCAVIATGSEISTGIIEDSFTPVVTAKLAEFPSTIIGTKVLGDDHKAQTDAIHDYVRQGAQMIVLTGGMSVDPDDNTPTAIRNSGADVVAYGAPVLPGSMIMLAYLSGDIPVLGLPGCVMYSARTIFDILLPGLFANSPFTNEFIAKLGYGGLCLKCETCSFPNCGFAAR